MRVYDWQIDRKTRSKDNVSVLADVLQTVKRSEFKDCHLASYKVRYFTLTHLISPIHSSFTCSHEIQLSQTDRASAEQTTFLINVMSSAAAIISSVIVDLL